MPQGPFSEGSFMFLQVGSLCQGTPVTCPPETAVVEAARLMREHNISGVVVVENGIPLGVVTVSDLRNLIVDGAGNVSGHKVCDIMSAGLISVRARDLVVEAIFRMAKHNIHRLTVFDDTGRLQGVITDADLLRLQTRTPLYLNQEIEAATSIEQLQRISARMVDMVSFAARAGTDIKSLVELISHLNDAFTQRIISLLDELEGIRLPAGAAYLVLGSEGRGEQTLRTDQDSAIIHADGLGATQFAEIERFSVRLVEALERIGVPRCPGDTMASNPQWRHSLTKWKELVEQWITVPEPDNLVNFGMFQDFRTIHGDAGLEAELRAHLLETTRRCSLFFPYMARHIARFPPPVGLFGHIRVERRGEHRGEVDLKKAGIFAVTEAASLLALEDGATGGSTWDKLERLRQRGVLPEKDMAVIEQSFSYLVQLRLQRQLRALAVGKPPSNYLNPLAIPELERNQLRQALRGVATLLRIIRVRFNLDAISR
ncbi:MAG: CBS domain-containing protein [Desulfuromonas sp.]|nr:CBS domain-containing protein [Desulfuromonas sp.]